MTESAGNGHTEFPPGTFELVAQLTPEERRQDAEYKALLRYKDAEFRAIARASAVFWAELNQRYAVPPDALYDPGAGILYRLQGGEVPEQRDESIPTEDVDPPIVVPAGVDVRTEAVAAAADSVRANARRDTRPRRRGKRR